MVYNSHTGYNRYIVGAGVVVSKSSLTKYLGANLYGKQNR